MAKTTRTSYFDHINKTLDAVHWNNYLHDIANDHDSNPVINKRIAGVLVYLKIHGSYTFVWRDRHHIRGIDDWDEWGNFKESPLMRNLVKLHLIYIVNQQTFNIEPNIKSAFCKLTKLGRDYVNYAFPYYRIHRIPHLNYNLPPIFSAFVFITIVSFIFVMPESKLASKLLFTPFLVAPLVNTIMDIYRRQTNGYSQNATVAELFSLKGMYLRLIFHFMAKNNRITRAGFASFLLQHNDPILYHSSDKVPITYIINQDIFPTDKKKTELTE